MTCYLKPILAAGLLLNGLFACDSGSSSGNRRGRFDERSSQAGTSAAVPVKVESVTRQEISDYILASTTLDAGRWVDVRARTTGQVVQILKEEGDRVSEGSLLARLDEEAARLQAAQMEVAYEEALRNFGRAEKMYRRKLVSEEDFANAKGVLDRGRAQFEQTKLNLSYTTISSPIAGVLTTRQVEVGSLVTNNQVVFSVADFPPLLARIRIPEKHIGKLSVGQEARVTVESAPGKRFSGKVEMISPVVEPESGTIKVTIEIQEGARGALRPGMFSSVYLITETHENALVIPKKGLVLEGEGNQVFVYEEDPASGMGTAVRRKVDIGFTDNERLEVLTGLREGDQLITVGHEGLRPGTSVRLVGGEVATREPVQASQRARARAERRGRGEAGGGSASADRMARMKDRMLDRFPNLKQAYERRVKQEPDLATDTQKWMAFVSEMQEKGVLPDFSRMQGRERRME